MQPNTRIGEVISIGDEMTGGARLDTNAQWLSRRLGDLGVDVQFHTTVGDHLQHNIDVLRIAAARADLIVCTGGLGPTRDDLTRQALAAALDTPLELRQATLNHIENLFSKRKREMPERNRVQAMFPLGSLEIFNPQGTAPGIDATFQRQDGSRSRFFCLPGVPAEMTQMFDATGAPRILQSGGGRIHIEHEVMKFFGVGESDMEHRLGDMIARDRVPRVGITVSAATISLRITAMAESQAACRAMIASTRDEILDRVGDLYFGDGEDHEQYHTVESMLLERSESLVTVEFGHAAMLAGWFASLGKTAAYRGGFCFADPAELCSVLELAPDCALTRLRQKARATWMLVVDEYPSLSVSDDQESATQGEQPLPAVDVELSVIAPDDQVFSTTSRLGGHPSIVHARIGKAALAWFRSVLSGNRAAAIAR